MKIKIKEDSVKEIILSDGYYGDHYESFSIKGDNILSVFVLGDYTSVKTEVSEYSGLDKAIPITKDEFDAQLETAFEIIRSKLNNTCPECSGTGEMD